MNVVVWFVGIIGSCLLSIVHAQDDKPWESRLALRSFVFKLAHMNPEDSNQDPFKTISYVATDSCNISHILPKKEYEPILNRFKGTLCYSSAKNLVRSLFVQPDRDRYLSFFCQHQESCEHVDYGYDIDKSVHMNVQHPQPTRRLHSIVSSPFIRHMIALYPYYRQAKPYDEHKLSLRKILVAQELAIHEEQKNASYRRKVWQGDQK